MGLGLAVDVEKSDGPDPAGPRHPGRRHPRLPGLLGQLRGDHPQDPVNKLTVDDFAGATVTLTNPGTIGTKQSVPRLMPGQGDRGRRRHRLLGRVAGRRPRAPGQPRRLQGDHGHLDLRPPHHPGAESGLFLKRVEELLLGADGFYDDIFRSLGVPYEAVQWRRDVNPIDRTESMLEKQMAVATLIRVYRVQGHLLADLDPLRWKEPGMATRLDPATYGLTIWDLDREFLTGGLGGRDRMVLSEILRVLRDAYCRTIGIEYMHIQDLDEQHWIQEQVEPEPAVPRRRRPAPHPRAAQRRRGLRALPRHQVDRPEALRHRGRREPDPRPRRHPGGGGRRPPGGVGHGHAHRGRLNVLTNIVGKNYDQVFKEFEGSLDPRPSRARAT